MFDRYCSEFKIIDPPFWLRHFVLNKNDARFVISDPENIHNNHFERNRDGFKKIDPP